MVKVKICGITNKEDALAAVNAGCDALGFNFYRKSSRYIAPLKARGIIEQLPKQVIKVGVFVNDREKNIKAIAKLCKLNILQFHGNETPEFCRRFEGYKIIKAFRVKGPLDLCDILKYKAFAYLFDAFSSSKMGGTGRKFDWKLVRHIDGIKRPIFLSGGITAGNVKQAIEIVKPDWVDACTSIEEKPGKKDHNKMKKFIRAAKK